MSEPSKRLERYFFDANAKAHSALALTLLREGWGWATLFCGHPLEDEWRDWAFQALQAYLAPRAGWVYVAVNPATHVPVTKVGQSRKPPQQRVSALRTAGVLGGYHLLDFWSVADRHYTEAAILRRLRAHFESDRELFNAPTQDVLTIARDVVQGEGRWCAQLGVLPSELTADRLASTDRQLIPNSAARNAGT